MKLIITEKPSVAKNIADALSIKTKEDGYFKNDQYYITWAFGHLLQLFDAKDYDGKYKIWKMDNFPFIPENFQYKIKPGIKNKEKPDARIKKQLKIIETLAKKREVTSIVSACDYDREGQIIGDIIINYLKINKPIERLLLNEWTKNEVLTGLANLKSNKELIHLSHAGLSRQWADWLIGINLTSVATLQFKSKEKKLINIGRVLLPTLKIIYDRQKEIENFVPRDYFKLKATFLTNTNETYEAFYQEEKKNEFDEASYLKEIKKLIKSNTTKGEITSIQTEVKKEYPPYLFNLSNLQGYITSKYKGFTSDKVLKAAQSLYEKKLITYPRTASIVLEESLIGKTKAVFEAHIKNNPFKDELKFHTSKRIFNSSKVESHSAIIPTYVIPKTLQENERIVYEAIVNRFLMQFMPIAQVEETTVHTKLLDVPLQGDFYTKGKVLLVEGWKKIEKMETKEVFLPKLKEKDQTLVKETKVESHQTKPPKLHTEKTLLKVMETCGKAVKKEEEFDEDSMDAILSGYSIGTPATRAETIKRLIDIDYIKLHNKNLTVTPFGAHLVETFPVKELFDIYFTGRLEKALAEIEKGNYTKEAFLAYVNKFIIQSVEVIRNCDQPIEAPISKKKTRSKTEKVSNTKEKEVKSKEVKQKQAPLGLCPICSHDIIEGKRGFGCSNFKNGCHFVLWKADPFLDNKQIELNEPLVKQILENMSFTWNDQLIILKYDAIKWQGTWEIK